MGLRQKRVSSISLLLVSSAVCAQLVTVTTVTPEVQACFDTAGRAQRAELSNWADAEPCNQALELKELSVREMLAVYINRALVMAALGDIEQALTDFESASNLSPQTASIFVHRGDLYLTLQRYQLAIQDYSKALQLSAANPEHILLNRGTAQARLANNREAEADFQQALDIRPGWSLAEQKILELLNNTVIPENQ